MRQTTVFVVDDEEQICSLLTRFLARDGLRVFAFTTPAAALAALERETPDLVLSDLMMPGITGLELAARAKAARPATKFVLMTGYASLENVVDAMRCGVDDFVTKPFGVAEIRAVVQRVLALGGDRGAAVDPVSVAAVPAADRATDGEPAPTALAAAVPASAPVGAPADVPADIRSFDPDGHLARRLDDVALVETLHAFLGDDIDSRDVVDRVAPALQSALGVARAVLLESTAGGTTFRLVSATGGLDAGDRGRNVELPLLALAGASGTAAAVAPSALGEIGARLGDGPAAAAPLRPRGASSSAGAGLLVVARARGAAPFDGDDLRLLGVAASAVGNVVRAARSAESAAEEYFASLIDVVAATEHRAPWFLAHSTRVRDLSVRLGERLGLAASDIDVIEAAAPLLDIGRVHLGDGVLTKAGRLSPDEWRELRSHAEVADVIVRPLGVLRHAKPVIRHHHENWDGSGYPDGLRGDDIPFLAALVRITDAYAALTSARPWRAALAPAEAVRRIVDFSGTHFHPQLVAAFTEMQLGGDGV